MTLNYTKQYGWISQTMLSKKKPDAKHIVWFCLYKVKELPLGVASERGKKATSGMLVMFCFLVWLLVPWMYSVFEKVTKLLWYLYLSVSMSYLNRDLKMNVRLEFHFEICAYVFKCTESVYLPKCSSKTDSQGRCTTFILWFFITCGLLSGLAILAEIKKNHDLRDEV